jgi:hypothetical protein
MPQEVRKLQVKVVFVFDNNLVLFGSYKEDLKTRFKGKTQVTYEFFKKRLATPDQRNCPFDSLGGI